MSKYQFPITEPNSDWMERLSDRNFLLKQTESDPKKQKLKDILGNVSGVAIILPSVEGDIDALLERGEFFPGDNILMSEGIPSQCHLNSAMIWIKNKSSCQLMTGYAMSSDGLWRQHSWCLSTQNSEELKIIETTIARILYFGFRLTNSESKRFWDNNIKN